MTSTTAPVQDGGTAVAAPHPTASLGAPVRIAAAATLVLGTGLQAAAWLVPQEEGLTASLAEAAANPARSRVVELLITLAVPFLVGGVAVYVLLGWRRSPRLAWTGGVLFAVGLIELGIHLGGE